MTTNLTIEGQAVTVEEVNGVLYARAVNYPGITASGSSLEAASAAITSRLRQRLMELERSREHEMDRSEGFGF